MMLNHSTFNKVRQLYEKFNLGVIANMSPIGMTAVYSTEMLQALRLTGIDSRHQDP